MNERTAASRRTGLRPVRNSRWQSSSVDLVQEGFDSEPMSVISANRRRRSTSISSVFLEPALRRDKHACPHAGCPNVYKQLSGLKYHLVHVSNTLCSQYGSLTHFITNRVIPARVHFNCNTYHPLWRGRWRIVRVAFNSTNFQCIFMFQV